MPGVGTPKTQGTVELLYKAYHDCGIFEIKVGGKVLQTVDAFAPAPRLSWWTAVMIPADTEVTIVATGEFTRQRLIWSIRSQSCARLRHMFTVRCLIEPSYKQSGCCLILTGRLLVAAGKGNASSTNTFVGLQVKAQPTTWKKIGAVSGTVPPHPLPLPNAAQIAFMDFDTIQFMHFSVDTAWQPPESYLHETNPTYHNCVAEITGLSKDNQTGSFWPCLDPAIFNPEKLDPDSWMEASAALGMKEICITAKHQGGFTLWCVAAVAADTVACLPGPGAA